MTEPTNVYEEFRLRPTNTVKATAAFLNLGRNETYAAIHRGELPSVRLGRTILVPTAKLLALLDS